MNTTQCKRPVRYSVFNNTVYMSPDMPPPELAPVSPRTTPYVVPPQQCAIDMYTGTMTCMNQERAFLDSNYSTNLTGPVLLPPYTNTPPQTVRGPCTIDKINRTITCPLPTPIATERRDDFGTPFPVAINPNYVYGSRVVDERPDSPLNRVLTRGPTGPWNLVGYITNNSEHAASRDRTMMVYAQRVDAGRNRYNYRVTDNNGVPLDISDNTHWKTDGDIMHVPGQHHTFTLHLYSQFR